MSFHISTFFLSALLEIVFAASNIIKGKTFLFSFCCSVRFLTGHSRNGGTDPLYVAENAADLESTLVVYMGLSTLPALAQKLVSHGLPPSTPAVAVERGTTPQQRMVSPIFELFSQQF